MPFRPGDKGGRLPEGGGRGRPKRQEHSLSLFHSSPLFDRESGRRESVLQLLPFHPPVAPCPLRCLGSSPGTCDRLGPWHSGRTLRSSWLSVLSVLRSLCEQDLPANPHTWGGSPGAGSQPRLHFRRTPGAWKSANSGICTQRLVLTCSEAELLAPGLCKSAGDFTVPRAENRPPRDRWQPPPARE